MRSLTTLAAASIAALAASVSADTLTLKDNLGIGAGIGLQRYDGSHGDNTMPYYRGFVKYNPIEWLGGRLTVGGGNISNGSSLFRTEYFSNAGLDVVLQPVCRLNPNVRPYLASGVSTTFGSSKSFGAITGDLDWNFYAPLELGVEYLVTENISAWAFGETYLHMDKWDLLDATITDGDYLDERDDLIKAGVGLTWRFGVKKDADKDRIPDALDKCPATPAGVKIDVTGCPLDEDKDAIADYLDKCAATPAGVKVDSLGCPFDTDKDGVLDYKDKCAATPAGVKIDTLGCPFDTDKDGVLDYKDKCAATPAGVKVDANGCPLDTDKDGVLDFQDKCAATPAGTKVDATGCPVVLDQDKDGIADAADMCANTPAGTKVDSTGCPPIVIEKGAKLVLEGIVFTTGSAEVDPVSQPVLRRAAEAIKKAPAAKIEIAGFTDNQGKVASNKKLSQKRADAVKAHLVAMSVPAAQLVSKGYGPEQPVADNATEEGRAKNRRIEFRVK